jgi:Protein of unknown function DUF262
MPRSSMSQMNLQGTGILEQQLKTQRRSVDFDTFDIQAQQLLAMLASGQIKVSPAYQRKFRWKEKQCSQFIESMMLGIPIPSLFMATNEDSTWEVVDGVQRLSTIVKFAGPADLREQLQLNGPLKLQELEKLTEFDELTLSDFSESLKLHFLTRPIKVVTLNDKSDLIVRYDLFERLNTGGVALSAQEIRNCIYVGKFADQLERWAAEPNFQTALKLTPLQQKDATAEECVLRFFAYLHRYTKFEHSVTDFLNRYMEGASKQFDYAEADAIFTKTFNAIARIFPQGIRRPGTRTTTPMNLFEAVAVGAALALQETNKLRTAGLNIWMKSDELRRFTTGATNNRSAVKGRIEFCRDRFLGRPYVSRAAA